MSKNNINNKIRLFPTSIIREGRKSKNMHPSVLLLMVLLYKRTHNYTWYLSLLAYLTGKFYTAWGKSAYIYFFCHVNLTIFLVIDIFLKTNTSTELKYFPLSQVLPIHFSFPFFQRLLKWK